jgi:hypothetical protein
MRVLLCVLFFLSGILRPGETPMTTTCTYQIITPDGVTFNLDSTCYKFIGLDNFGMPPVRTYTHQVPGQPGAVLDDLLDDVRVITVTHTALGGDIDDVFRYMNDVMANYRYNRTLTIQPLRLRVTFGAKSADLYCYYGGMITSKIDNVHALFGFTLIAYDPYWYSTTQTTAWLDLRDSMQMDDMIGRVDGLWNDMGYPGAGGGGWPLWMTKDASGDMYVGGGFLNWDGIPAADYIAKYTMSTGVWSAVGATPLNNSVYAIAIAANGDIYICGLFTNAGGAGTADYIAVLKSGAADWTTITAGGAPNGNIYALCLTAEGTLWAGGVFDSIGGVAAECIAEYNIAAGTWAARAGLDNTTDTVRAIVQGLDGTVYIGGTFTNASADPDADYLAYWDGAAWAAVGGPLTTGIGIPDVHDMAVAADGTLYVCGSFTAWAGVTVNYVGKWDGSAVSDLDGGVDSDAYNVYIDDDDGTVYIAGDFTTASGDPIPSRIAAWNGHSWHMVPAYLPAGPAAHFFSIGDDFFLTSGISEEAYVPGDTSITYSGNVHFPPTLNIPGPGTLYYIRNETSEQEIYSNVYINAGETITFGLGDPGEIPAGKSVTSSWSTRPNAGNLLGKVQTPTALARFALAPAPIASSGVNLINVYMDRTEIFSNTSFETAGGGGADIWANWTESVGDGALANETTIVHSGVDAAKFTAGATVNTQIYQTGTVTPNSNYRLTMWTYGDGTNAGRYYIYDVTNAAEIVGTTSTGVTAAAWTEVIVHFTAPAACVQIRVTLLCPNVNGGIAYFDDVTVEPEGTIQYYNRYDSLQAALD